MARGEALEKTEKGSTIHIIGAGLAGLSLARELLDRGYSVRVAETRDRIGGISILDPEASGLIEKLGSEISVSLQSTATRLGERVAIISSTGVEGVAKGVSATGFRVASPIELGIVGDRPAGVYPFHAALDLLIAGLSPGRVIAIYGANRYSLLLAEKLAQHGRKIYVISSNPVRSKKDLEILVGRVRELKGSQRLSEIRLDNNTIKADTLVIAIFKPWNPFPELPSVGHASLEIYDPKALLEASRLLAINLGCEEQARRRVKVQGAIQAFPETLTPCLRELLVVKPGGGEVWIGDRSYSIEGDYAVIRTPGDSEPLVVRGS
ncbi:monooxygenase [Desulfurococcaceae archaeon AG1]|jgi:hypothetical protein|nr:monooxygenase [Desulfurococcaceae archaeon AG1]